MPKRAKVKENTDGTFTVELDPEERAAITEIVLGPIPSTPAAALGDFLGEALTGTDTRARAALIKEVIRVLPTLTTRQLANLVENLGRGLPMLDIIPELPQDQPGL